MGLIMEIMERNPYTHFFRSLRHLDVTENTKFSLSKNPTLDQSVYNSPIDDVPSNETRTPYIIVWGQSFVSHHIYILTMDVMIRCSIHCCFRLGIVNDIRA